MAKFGGFNLYSGKFGGFNLYSGKFWGFNLYSGKFGGFNLYSGKFGGFNLYSGKFGGFNLYSGKFGGSTYTPANLGVQPILRQIWHIGRGKVGLQAQIRNTLKKSCIHTLGDHSLHEGRGIHMYIYIGRITLELESHTIVRLHRLKGQVVWWDRTLNSERPADSEHPSHVLKWAYQGSRCLLIQIKLTH